VDLLRKQRPIDHRPLNDAKALAAMDNGVPFYVAHAFDWLMVVYGAGLFSLT